jgi:hypothetical protein
MKYVYFVSFECNNGEGSANRNAVIDRTQKILNNKDIKGIHEYIQSSQNVRCVILNNIILLDTIEN